MGKIPTERPYAGIKTCGHCSTLLHIQKYNNVEKRKWELSRETTTSLLLQRRRGKLQSARGGGPGVVLKGKRTSKEKGGIIKKESA